MAAPEATIANYGLANPAQAINKVISNAFAYPGYVVKVSTTAGTFSGTSAVTDVPAGYTIKSCVPATMQAMVNVTEGAAQTNQLIGVQGLIPGQEAYLMLGATAAIAVGDLIAPSSAAGCVCPRSSSGLASDACIVFARASRLRVTRPELWQGPRSK
jgi:NADPH-dependent curcumin reductase CurA